jgi:hypothetical protein
MAIPGKLHRKAASFLRDDGQIDKREAARLGKATAEYTKKKTINSTEVFSFYDQTMVKGAARSFWRAFAKAL